jgi:hypothetical protein
MLQDIVMDKCPDPIGVPAGYNNNYWHNVDVGTANPRS